MDAPTPCCLKENPGQVLSEFMEMEDSFSEVRILVEQKAARAKRIVRKWISLEGRKKVLKIKSTVSLNRSGVGSSNNRPVRFTDSVLAGHQMRKAMLKNSQTSKNSIPNDINSKRASDSEDSEEERLLKSKRRK